MSHWLYVWAMKHERNKNVETTETQSNSFCPVLGQCPNLEILYFGISFLLGRFSRIQGWQKTTKKRVTNTIFAVWICPTFGHLSTHFETSKYHVILQNMR